MENKKHESIESIFAHYGAVEKEVETSEIERIN